MGYALEQFIDAVDPSLICYICQKVLQDVVECGACQAEFCRACITTELEKKKACVACDEELSIQNLRQPRVIRNFLAKLEIKCLFAPEGCKKILGLNSYEIHLGNCDYNPGKPIPCDGCGLWIPQQKVSEHNCLIDLRSSNEALRKEVEELKATSESTQKQLEEVLDKINDIFDQVRRRDESMYTSEREHKREIEELWNKVQEHQRLIEMPYRLREQKLKMPGLLSTIKKSTPFSSRIERAFLSVDRRNYCSAENAYEDEQVIVSPGRWLSPVTWSVKAIKFLEPWIAPGHKILVIRSAPGYELAILADLVGESGMVYGTENLEERVDMTHRNLSRDRPELLSDSRVKVVQFDPNRGYPAEGPYNVIINKYKEGIPVLRDNFFIQLAPGGIMLYGNTSAPNGWSAFMKASGGDIEEVECDLE